MTEHKLQKLHRFIRSFDLTEAIKSCIKCFKCHHINNLLNIYMNCLSIIYYSSKSTLAFIPGFVGLQYL